MKCLIDYYRSWCRLRVYTVKDNQRLTWWLLYITVPFDIHKYDSPSVPDLISRHNPSLLHNIRHPILNIIIRQIRILKIVINRTCIGIKLHPSPHIGLHIINIKAKILYTLSLPWIYIRASFSLITIPILSTTRQFKWRIIYTVSISCTCVPTII